MIFDVDTVPSSVLVLSTFLSLTVAAMILFSFYCRTFRLSKGAIGRQVTHLEKRVALVHYLVCIPLFELFVIWGQHFNFGIRASSPSAVLLWVAMLLAQLLALVVAFFSSNNYRMMVHVTQILAAACSIEFFIDKAVRNAIGVEGMIISALIVCGVIEIYSVPDFFRPDSRMHQDYEMANTVAYANNPAAYERDVTGRYVPMAVGAAEEAEESGYTSEGVNAQIAATVKEKERVLGIVLRQIMETDSKAGVNELRKHIVEWQTMLAVFTQADAAANSASSTVESDHLMPWDKWQPPQSRPRTSSGRGLQHTSQRNLLNTSPVRIKSGNYENSLDEAAEEF